MSGSGWASDDAATRLAGDFHSHSAMRCGAVRCVAVGRFGGAAEGGEGEKQGARVALLLGAADETAWGRRLVADAGLRVLGFGRAVRCAAVQHSAAQETRRAGALAGPEIELMQRSQVMLFMGWHGRLKAAWNEPQKRAPVEDPEGRVESRL